MSGTWFCPKLHDATSAMDFPPLRWRRCREGLPVIRVGQMRVPLVGVLPCGIGICLPCVSTTPLWECCLTERRLLKIAFTLLFVALHIVR